MIQQPTRITARMTIMALAVAGLAACDNDDGPAEELGERIDNTTQELKEAGEAAKGN